MNSRDDEWNPLDAEEHALQLQDLKALLEARASKERWLLDLGAGDGRIARPLTELGWRVLALDSSAEAAERCAGAGIAVRLADFLDPRADLAPDDGEYGAIWCLGHTLMLIHDVDQALRLMTRLRGLIDDHGWFAVDAFCDPCWREVAEGAWQNGVSEDGSQQLVWADGDNVFSLREGERVNPDDWTLHADEPRHRLWSMGELTLLARASGWKPPAASPGNTLLLFRPDTDG